MVDDGRPTLTPDEIGAFVAQWAQRRTMDLAELASLLGVDEAQAASLLRQARGRTHMDAWLQDQRPQRGIERWLWGIVAGCLLFGCLVGGLIANYLGNSTDRQPENRPLNPPPIQVSTTEPTANATSPPAIKVETEAKPADSSGVMGDGDLSRENPDAAKVGAQVGRMLADQTVILGHRPISGATPAGLGGPMENRSILKTQLVETRLEPIPVDVAHMYHDMTDHLKTPLPSDAVIELQTPTDYYTMRGPQIKNYKDAARIKAQELIEPMWELLMYSVNSNLGQQYRRHSNGKAIGRIRIAVGQSAASVMIRFSDGKPDGAIDYAKKDAGLYRDLSKQVLDGIKTLGPNLFVEPARVLTGGTS